MKNVMVDLETLGTAAGCSILSIGAVYFDETKLGQEFYQVISRRSCFDAGLKEDPDTVEWWNKQNHSARQVLADAAALDAMSISDALLSFNAFLKLDTGVKVWGNGADFDQPILIAAYRATGVKQGWAVYNGCCYRTLKNLVPGPKLVRTGTHHNALDDARSQAAHAVELFQVLGRQGSHTVVLL